MRVLQVCNGYPHRAYGGVELHTHRLSTALGARGHEVAVFTRHSDINAPDGTLVEGIVDGAVVWSVVNDFKGGRFLDHYFNQEVGARFEQVLSDFRPNVVHIQHLIGLSADLPERARARGFRVVASVLDCWYICQRANFQHHDGRHCGGPSHESCIDCVMVGTQPAGSLPSISERVAMAAGRSARLLARRGAPWPIPAVGPRPNKERFRALRGAIQSFERISTPSRFIVREYASHGMPLPEQRTFVMPLGVDRSQFGRPTTVSELPIRRERPLRVGFIGQHLHHKGPHTLLEALRLVPKLPLEVHLYGMRWPDHAYEAELRRLLESDPRAQYRGRFADDERPDVLASFDVLAVPSTCPESFGITTREAFLAGRPVLSTDRGALPESVRDGTDGLLVPGEDPRAMAEALRRLVEEPALLPRLLAGAFRARDSVKSIETYAAEVEEKLYAEGRPGLISSNAST